MSMFDDFRDDSREFRCPKCNSVQFYFQTKDLENCLLEYRINEQGFLQIMVYNYETPKPEEQIQVDGIKLPMLKRTKIGWQNLTFTGSICAYSPCDECNNWWHETVYLFKNGLLIDIEDHSHENK